MRRLDRVLLALGAVLLVSCGGGGGDSDAPDASGTAAEESVATAATTDDTITSTDDTINTTDETITDDTITTTDDTINTTDDTTTDDTTTDDTTTDDTVTTTDDTVTTTDAEDTSTSLPAGAQAGLFDFNGDGTNESTCGTADFQAGLVVRTYCDDLTGYNSSPESGATLVPGALFGIPGPPDDPRDTPVTSGASVSPQHLQSAIDGKEVVVYTMSSDTVFAVSSDQLQDPARASLSALAAGIRESFPGASLQVRGHTDSRGNPDSNQSLSERRAAAVATFLVSAGFDPAAVSSVGLGQTQPNYVEDGDVGRDQNRRIELVVRPS